MTNNSNSLFTYDENDLFYFETDHLALKGNKDYCEVLKTLVILSAQREKAIKLPNINFKKFDVNVPEEDLKVIYSDSVSNKPEEDGVQIKQTSSNSKVWTPEEQKRLEELLVTYPPEPVEMRRFQKIARALGNRTVQQVTSRVQKYFLKLYKAGLPIPGRIPKSGEKYKKSVLHKHQRHNHYLWKPTTFFPDLFVPVMMNDLDNIPGPSLNSSPSTSTSGSSNYLISTEYHHNTDIQLTKTESEMQLDLLKRIRIEKVKEQEGNYNSFTHIGFRCDYCDVEPIIGPRWHCMVCNDSVDYCTDCVLSQMYSDNSHSLHHTLAVFYNDTENPSLPFSDSDSYSGSTTTKNYESDSNNSIEFEGSNSLENLTQYENDNSETKLKQCGDCDYKNMSDLIDSEGPKNTSTSEIDNYDFLNANVTFKYNE
ncbi:hypothetical protein NQ314_015903 [Rhamnusium bicolor]|uniref:ZZ-type domain-containing protein n=1 Tax=Rhamnusium bicolor TaxID=1586634 RepID=A0AAV8WYA2_9CUCU|nr:hypothetical protein NQ314_015903 [Rhamnusium bicolor]